MKATIEEIKSALSEIKSHDHFNYLYNLLQRWECESEYEDWADYDKAIRSKLKYLTIVKTTKRPFGIIFKVADTKVTICYKKKGKYIYRHVTYIP